MGKHIIIAEKPSVGRTYAKVLGLTADDKKEGYYENNDWIVTWAIGHLIEMSYPDKYSADYEKWDINTLPFIPREYKYEVKANTSKQFKIIKNLYNRKDVDIIYYAGDSGREGIYIQDLIRQEAGVREGIKELVVWIDSQTEDEIKRGIREAKPISDYQNLIDSAHARAKEDYSVGINFTRALSIKRGFVGDDKKYHAVTVGRVMTAVLGMIVRREQEIENFKETSFYKIHANTDKGILDWKAIEGTKLYNSNLLHDNIGFLDKVNAQRFVDNFGADPHITIEDIKRVKELKYAPSLYNLAELQSDCSKEFKISPDETLEIAQKLYEAKLTTYPRTDARVLTEAIANEINKNLNGLKKIGIYEDIVNYVLSSEYKSIIKQKRYVDNSKVTDHYAIIPTGEGRIDSLSDLELYVYQKIVERFLSIFYPPAEYEKIEVIGKNKEHNEYFFATEKPLVKKGYLAITDKKKEISKVSLEYTKGEELEVKFAISEGKTTPPKRYTSGSMILAMENAGNLIEDEELREQIKSSGIGTSATRAETIKKLTKIQYIELNKKTQVLTPSFTGKMVYNIVNEIEPLLTNIKMTASWEKGLSQIAEGKISATMYLDKFYKFVIETVEKIKRLEGRKVTEGMDRKVIGTCPLCGGEVLETSFGYGCSNYKEKDCKFSIGTICGKKISEENAIIILNGKTAPLIKGFKSKAGKNFDAKLRFDLEEKKLKFVFDDVKEEESSIECPHCATRLIKGKWAYKCPECDFSIQHTIAQKPLNEEEMKSLLSGRTPILDGFISKKGKKFMAGLEFDVETDEIKFVFEGNGGE